MWPSCVSNNCIRSPKRNSATSLRRTAKLRYVTWCQEEPANQGAWYSSQHHMRRVLARHDISLYLFYAGRVAFASPASGYFSKHIDRQQRLVEEALIG